MSVIFKDPIQCKDNIITWDIASHKENEERKGTKKLEVSWSEVMLWLATSYSLCTKIYPTGASEVWDFYHPYEIDIIKYFAVFYLSVTCNIVYTLKVPVGFFLYIP